MPFCEYCGHALDSGASFCPNCGKTVKNAAPQPVQPQAQS
ncbi:MAG: zinc-ribbon domain-containing protein [Nitrososphaerota archaeon]|nr:zinc-ribbon domain-containing protein [Nitrososphaerota archaeon]